jgi:dienelactone hydrolase
LYDTCDIGTCGSSAPWQTRMSAFAEEMENASADYQLIVYGNAMHGFTHETATGQQRGVLYHAQADARSSVAIQGLFEEVFR